MSSDDYRPPWLPVNPVPEPAETSDNVPGAEPDTFSPAKSWAHGEPGSEHEATSPTTPLTGWPFAPMPEGSTPPRPARRPRTASSPSPAAAAAFFGARGDRDATPDESEPVESESVSPQPGSPTVETPSPPATPTQQVPATPTSPYLSGTRPRADHSDAHPGHHSNAQDSWLHSAPPGPPVTGSVPTPGPNDLTPSKPQVPHSAHAPASAPTPESTHESQPPATPRTEADEVPTPIAADEAEIIAPILPPPDTEILPRAGDDEVNYSAASVQGLMPWRPASPPEPQGETDSPQASADPVWQLGASAISNASLQAAGAPTPTSGVPRVSASEETFPSFGDEEPFVPRFEPATRPLSPQTPSVSFTEPAPRPSSPLSELDVPETDEPAYTPRVELSTRAADAPGPTRVPPVTDVPVEHDASAPAPASEDATPTPPRPWSPVADDDVEFAAPTILPAAGLPPETALDSEPEPASDGVSKPEAHSDEETEPDLDATGDGTIADQHEVAAVAPRKRRRWIWWLIAALVVASAAGVLVYRTFLLPEPITLPVPTITATPPGPQGAPITIADPSDFVAALPSTVQTYVLREFESIDPLTEPTLPARTAEHAKLSYGEAAGSPAFVVDAYQHYNVDDAQQAYNAYAEGATDVEPVLVDGEQVGERALTEQGATGTVVWRNVTAVFVLTGPAESVLDFYEHYGV
ncbi:hypothetical protein [Demequina sp.]|uniref:hypothetical protein n=1 Tax=Demequina sp. TaxID=2050685 RepID=UPI0025B9CFD3|nr:hypothetical protein [Demequina sp.]